MRRHRLRRRYGRASGRTYQTAYGTRVEGHRIVSESGARLASFDGSSDAIAAWAILAEIEGRWGDSADTFDRETWRGVRTLWAQKGLSG